MRETEIGSAPFRLRTFTVVACLSAGSAICRVRAIEMPLRVIVASGRRTATALTRQVKALDAVTIYPAPDHQCGQRPKHPRCWKTPPPWVMRCSIEWRRVMLQPSYRCHDHSSRRLVELHPVDRHRPRRRDPLRRDRAHRRRHILRSRANDIGRSAGADPARQLVGWRREAAQRMDEVLVCEMLDERRTGFTYLRPGLDGRLRARAFQRLARQA